MTFCYAVVAREVKNACFSVCLSSPFQLFMNFQKIGDLTDIPNKVYDKKLSLQKGKRNEFINLIWFQIILFFFFLRKKSVLPRRDRASINSYKVNIEARQACVSLWCQHMNRWWKVMCSGLSSGTKKIEAIHTCGRPCFKRENKINKTIQLK